MTGIIGDARAGGVGSRMRRIPHAESFILVNDHDPRPLFCQFQAERAGAFTWRYLEEGSDVWRVEIAKPALREAAAAGVFTAATHA